MFLESVSVVRAIKTSKREREAHREGYTKKEYRESERMKRVVQGVSAVQFSLTFDREYVERSSFPFLSEMSFYPFFLVLSRLSSS